MKKLGWEPPKSLEESVEKTVVWYLDPKNIHWLGRTKI
jgi:dTDP-D-glucose 4,6-dehydratase